MVNAAAAVHLTTELEREQSLQALHEVPTFVVPNPVDLSEFVPSQSRASFRSQLGIPDDAFTMIYSGRLHPRKALPVLLHAAARVRRSGVHLHLLLAGPDGPDGAGLRALSRDLQLDRHVHFLGALSRSHLADAVAASDAVILVPHPGENFGNACVEAMGLGLPAILSSNVGIAREAEADGGALVVAVDETAVAGAIVRLAEDVRLRREMGEAAARSVEARFAPAAVANAMTRRYSEAMA
jgi:glycosyltransferase involved in cell wall biosynthesis